LTEKTTIP